MAEQHPRPPQPHPVAGRVRFEAVFLGNLPGFAAPWLTQYAHFVAQESSAAVAIVHISPAQAEVELIDTWPATTDDPVTFADRNPGAKPVGPYRNRLRLVGAPPETAPDGAADAPPMPPGAAPDVALDGPPVSHSATNLAAAIQILVRDPHRPAGTILVHLSDPSTPETLQLALGIPHWTIICGAYDAATAGAYRLLRQLTDGAASFSPEPSSGPKSVSVMVMGAEEDRSRATAKKVTASSIRFLHMPVQLRGWRKQMVPVSVCSLGTYTGGGPLGGGQSGGGAGGQPLIEQLLDSIDALGLTATSVRDAQRSSEPEASATAIDGMQQPSEPEESALSIADTATATPTATVDDALDDVAEQPVIEPPGVKPPARRTRKSQAQPTVAPDLASFLDDTGGAGASHGTIALAARCPFHRRTQLVLDRNGRLHLLRQHSASASTPGNSSGAQRHIPESAGRAGEELRGAILDLVEAQAWVRQHLDLLRMTQPQCRFDPAAKPALHLFTDDAKTAALLVGRLGRRIRLHLLQQVHVDGGAAWVCNDLN
jgi:hypothetical protein